MNLEKLDTQYFTSQLEPYRPELRAHCYRMLGSTQDAEDMVQETFLRAWRGRDSFEGRAALRTWLYSIATHACLDHLKKAKRRTLPQMHDAVSSKAEAIAPPILEPIWLQPYPDEWLAAETNTHVEQQIAEREQITLAFIAVLQLLPPRQRAILLLRDVLDWRAREVATLLDTTESAVKSALHRARSTLADHQDTLAVSQPEAELDSANQQLLDDYVEAWENADVEALVDLLTTDATFSMPPIPSWLRGHVAIGALLRNELFVGSDSRLQRRLRPTNANGQPAFGLYLRADDGTYQAYGIQVLTLRDGQISDIITFKNADLLKHFGLEEQLQPERELT